MSPVTITRTTINRNGKGWDRQKESFEGVRHERNNKVYLQFKDQLSDDEEPVPSLLTIENNMVRLHRNGSFGGDMVFALGESMQIDYHTPMGVLTMELATSRADVFLSEEVVEVDLQYQIFSEGELLSDIDMRIRAVCSAEIT